MIKKSFLSIFSIVLLLFSFGTSAFASTGNSSIIPSVQAGPPSGPATIHGGIITQTYWMSGGTQAYSCQVVDLYMNTAHGRTYESKLDQSAASAYGWLVASLLGPVGAVTAAEATLSAVATSTEVSQMRAITDKNEAIHVIVIKDQYGTYYASKYWDGTLASIKPDTSFSTTYRTSIKTSYN
jgi:hypothetical protein